jgi:hypothetical protein
MRTQCSKWNSRRHDQFIKKRDVTLTILVGRRSLLLALNRTKDHIIYSDTHAWPKRTHEKTSSLSSSTSSPSPSSLTLGCLFMKTKIVSVIWYFYRQRYIYIKQQSVQNTHRFLAFLDPGTFKSNLFFFVILTLYILFSESRWDRCNNKELRFAFVFVVFDFINAEWLK